ncbi:MAG: YjjG family noncanonical pyrimidine nucleotidase [Proteobacteria bacterium]|nr:YjjG family noncanonical pyrimidine nucleotidase [Pseudomonadota bacterium]
MSLKLVLLDLDDTLLDFTVAEDFALKGLFRFIDIEDNLKNRKIYKDINADFWSRCEQGLISKEDAIYGRFEEFFRVIGTSLSPLEANQKYLSLLSQVSIEIPGALQLIEFLQKSYEVMIVTNGEARTQRSRIAKSSFEKYLSQIIVSDEVGYLKPHPLIFQHAMSLARFKTKPDQVIMIGDNLHADVSGAKSLGINTIWFNGKGQISQRIKHRYFDVLALLSKI